MATQKRKTVSYFLQRPKGSRKSYSVHAKHPEGTYSVIKHDIINSLNLAYRSNQIPKESIEAQLKDFIDKNLKEKKTVSYCSENAEILDRYWHKFYENKKIDDKDSAYNRLRRAVEALGMLSIKSATEEEIQTAADTACDQRRVVSALTSLLRFSGRSDVVLQKNKKKRKRVSHLSLAEYKKVRPHIHNKHVMIFGDVCMASGARTGEGFAVDTDSYNQAARFVLIDEQINRKKRNKSTKTSGTRRAPIISDFVESIETWINTPDVEKMAIRGERFAEIIQQAVDAAGINKKIVWHDLRHSYAIHLLSKGVEMSKVSQALGISLQVCQEYYAGFDLSDDSIKSVTAKI